VRKLNPNDPTKYTLDFMFNANYECIITIYICARECRNAANIPLCYVPEESMMKAQAYKFSSGIRQKFPPNLFIVDTAQYDQGPTGVQGCRKEDLFNEKDDFYPIVITIETVYPENYVGKGRKNI